MSYIPSPWQHRRLLVSSIRSRHCPACTAQKQVNKSVCSGCWAKLTSDAQRALYNRIGDGYEEAFENAMKSLGIDDPYLHDDQDDE